MKKLEIACFNAASALTAQSGGADRVELCADQQAGGITPAYEMVKAVRQQLQMDIMVMIRPRGGNFVYTESEFAQMKKDTLALKNTGINGFVFGILTEAGNVNKEQNAELVKLAQPLNCTFHRAFDVATNVLEALEDVIDCGFNTILTSGQKANAVEGMNTLIEITNRVAGRIVIMPGGGVRSLNLALLAEKINTQFFHSSAITDESGMANVEEVKLLKQKLN